MSCEVEGCNSQSSDSFLELFSFPKIKSVCDKWIKFCRKQISNQNLTKLYICSLHFEEEAYINEIKESDGDTLLIRKLSETAVPTLHPPNKSSNVSYIKLDPAKYGHIKTPDDLLKLKAANKILEMKLQHLEASATACRNYIAQQKVNVELILKGNPSDITAKDLLSKVLTPCQIKLLSGNKKTNWSKDDLSIACTIRYLSNRHFYNYLTGQLNFPLPADSSIRRFVSGTRHKFKADTSSKSES